MELGDEQSPGNVRSPAAARHRLDEADRAIENRRQLCFSIVSFLTSNPKTIAKLMTTYQDDIALLAKNAMAIEGNYPALLLPQTSLRNARQSKFCFASFSSHAPRAPPR